MVEISSDCTGPRIGPREPVDRWRSRRTHSQRDMMKVYKEIFFAGFPCRRPYHSATTDVLAHVRCFPHKFVHDFFQQYGTVEHFVYDEDRGMGSVTFASGDDAEGCYLAVHLSLIPPPNQDGSSGTATWELDELGEPMQARRNRQPDVLLSLEFAQCCPFVNPLLLLRDCLQAGEVSRHLLRTFPLLDRHYRPSTAEAVVTSWVAALPQGDSHRDNETLKSAGAVVRQGPHYPGGDVDPPLLGEALWRVIRPSSIPAAAGNTVTVLHLWWEYYNQYQVHKTQPSPQRIRDAAHQFAQRPSVVQEIVLLQQQSRELSYGDAEQAETLMRRLVYDDLYHSVCSYLCLKQKLKNDPSWASLMRDIYSPKVERELTSIQATVSPIDKELRKAQEMLAKTMEQDPAAESAWLRLPITTAAANVIENVKFLRHVRRGEIDKNGKVLPTSKDSDESSDYPTPVGRRSDEDLYMEITHTIEGFATTGSASALLGLCEDPHVFRTAPGHIGYEELHHRSSQLWAFLRMLWVPLTFLVLIVGIILYLQAGMGGRARRSLSAAAPGDPPSFSPDASTQAMADRLGARIRIRPIADL